MDPLVDPHLTLNSFMHGRRCFNLIVFIIEFAEALFKTFQEDNAIVIFANRTSDLL